MTSTVEQAYAICRRIARREAKNFYYAFVALPKAKRNAICAVYAFMRHADDLSDDESKSREERRAGLGAWLTAWHEAAQGGATDDPVFIALRDAQARFHITTELLDQLVQGTAMDLDRDAAKDSHGVHPLELDTYATFEDLYRYCYYVASVVGLVCIRIFEYSDSRAEKLAEETGIAFQLTNILRDIREDAERDRIYLPLEDLERFGVSVSAILGLKDGHRMTDRQRRLLEFEANRAEHFYKSGEALLPLIAVDARPALWVLITIYHRLLQHIRQRKFDVFSERVSVPTLTKLTILGRGMFRMYLGRLQGGSA